MKKIIFILAIVVCNINSYAQIQRQVKPIDNAVFVEDSIKQSTQRNNKKQIFSDLDLTKEQLGKLKEIRQANKAKRQAINDNDSLSIEEKRLQLKAINKSADASIKEILTDEQWQKFQAQRKNKFSKQQNMDESPMQ